MGVHEQRVGVLETEATCARLDLFGVDGREPAFDFEASADFVGIRSERSATENAVTTEAAVGLHKCGDKRG
jgi:hypothetical protein